MIVTDKVWQSLQSEEGSCSTQIGGVPRGSRSRCAIVHGACMGVVGPRLDTYENDWILAKSVVGAKPFCNREWQQLNNSMITIYSDLFIDARRRKINVPDKNRRSPAVVFRFECRTAIG